MCRSPAKVCSELGVSPNAWSKVAPLPPPRWFEDELALMIRAVEAAKSGDLDAARNRLLDVKGEAMRRWYLDHGQNAGIFRYKGLGKPIAQAQGPAVETRKSPSPSQQREVLARDGYRCRYCGLRILSLEALKSIERLLGSDLFVATKKNDSHGAALVFRCSVDHVVPLSLGGTTTVDNLVAACYSCNFGKWNYSLEQIGVEDPRNRPVERDAAWDGLTSLVNGTH